MTDEQVKKGLERCIGGIAKCDKWCPYYEIDGNCSPQLKSDALALINRFESDLYYAEAKAQGKTAKDILQSLAQFRAVSPALSKTWYALAEKYGVEVK